MKKIKSIRCMMVFLFSLLLIPASSFAIVDASVYGGYDFGGEIDNGTTTGDVSGYHYGGRAHINLGIPLVLSVGLGLFYQIAPLEYELEGDTGDLKQTSYGIDAYVQLDLPVIPINPFVRYGIAIKDEVEVTSGSDSSTLSENFKSSYYGIGIAYTLFDAIVVDLKLFGEYLYTTTEQEDDVKIKGNAVNIGVMLSL